MITVTVDGVLCYSCNGMINPPDMDDWRGDCPYYLADGADDTAECTYECEYGPYCLDEEPPDGWPVDGPAAQCYDCESTGVIKYVLVPAKSPEELAEIKRKADEFRAKYLRPNKVRFNVFEDGKYL